MTRRKDGRWQHQPTINGIRKTFYSTEASESKAWKDIQHQMILYSGEQKERHKFGVLANRALEFKESSVGYKTLESYETALKHLDIFEKCNIEDITPAMVQGLLDSLANKKYSYSTVAKVRTFFGVVVNYAVVYENIEIVNYMRSIKIPRNATKGKVKAPDDIVIDTIAQYAEKAKFGMWAMILLCTGARRGELASLQKRDIDLENNIIRIYRSVEFVHNQPRLKNKPKSENSIGDVPLLDILRPSLEKICKNLDDNDFLFGGAKPLTESMIKKRWSKYCKEIGYTFNGHQLRHAYAKLLYRSGVDVKTAQRLLRHADIGTTMNIYTEFDEEVTNKNVIKVNEYMSSTYKQTI